MKLTVGGVARTFMMYTPQVAHGPLPLVVVLHGLGATTTDEALRTGFGVLAIHDQAIVAYPAGIDGNWNVGNGCCSRPGHPLSRVDDVAFVNAVVATIEATQQIDHTRVYLVGYSAGGKLAWRFSCAGGTPFTAIATYGAVPVTACPASGSPVTLLIADGTADTSLPYWGSTRLRPPIEPVTTVVAGWRARDRCPATSTTASPGRAVVLSTWSGCAGGASVTFVRYPGLDHRWPNVVVVPAYADGEQLIWAWLATRQQA